jgi:hypothetical protein
MNLSSFFVALAFSNTTIQLIVACLGCVAGRDNGEKALSTALLKQDS